MKFLVSKYKKIFIILIFPYLAIYVLCLTKTDKEVTLTGDISPVASLIEIDTNYSQAGSFNSVFVINYNKATLFQTLLLKKSVVNDVETSYEGYAHLTTAELNKMGKIQHNQAVETSIIVAYNHAAKIESNIKLDYKLEGAIISYYSKNVNNLKIGDLIYKINDYDVNDDSELFREYFNNRQLLDVITILRDGKSLEVVLNEDNYKKFSFYSKYFINYDNSYPKIKVNSTATQGSSGGLLQTLSNFNSLLETDYSLGKTIAGTGTIDVYGSVGIIGGVKQKIHTAYKNKVDIFFCPSENYTEALEAYNSLKNKERMMLVKVETFNDALEYLISCL